MGIVVPAGEKDLVVRFHSNYFAWGAAISATTASIAIGLLLWPAIVRRIHAES